VEIVCTDAATHRARVERRLPAVEGLTLPTWEQIKSRHYEAWDRPRLQIDTAAMSVDDAVETIVAAFARLRAGHDLLDR